MCSVFFTSPFWAWWILCLISEWNSENILKISRFDGNVSFWEETLLVCADGTFLGRACQDGLGLNSPKMHSWGSATVGNISVLDRYCQMHLDPHLSLNLKTVNCTRQYIIIVSKSRYIFSRNSSAAYVSATLRNKPTTKIGPGRGSPAILQLCLSLCHQWKRNARLRNNQYIFSTISSLV